MNQPSYHQIRCRSDLEENFKNFLWCSFSSEREFTAELFFDEWKFGDGKTWKDEADKIIHKLQELIPGILILNAKVRLNIQGKYKVLILECELPGSYMQEGL
jgi:hypothetical protein